MLSYKQGGIKMNKYQEALNYLKGGNLFGELSNEALDSILELVDKETPMKPNRNDRYCGGCVLIDLLKVTITIVYAEKRYRLGW